jgi:16S rRNA processing protein RimM
LKNGADVADRPAWIAIGQIARPHGLKGAVRVTPLTDIPDRLRRLHQVVVEKPDGTQTTLNIESVIGAADAPLIKFHGLDSPEQAGDLRDAFLLVRREDLPALPEDTFYVFDLIGYAVQTEDGQPVGTLSDVLRLPANDAYVVRRADREVLIPAVKAFVRVDPENRRIVVRGIEELLE